MVSLPGEEAEKARALEGLQSAAGFLRSRAARALSTRIVPELHFELDRGLAARRAHQPAARRAPARGAELIGAVLVDKPAGLTSHDVVRRVRRVLGTRAAGHTGTLDPFATGLLVVLVGRATRLARFVEAEAKTYLATARLGVRDRDRRPHGRAAGRAGRSLHGLRGGGARPRWRRFAGEQRQRPPRYSAKHVGGERSYRLARRGRGGRPRRDDGHRAPDRAVGYAPPDAGLPGHGERRHLHPRAGPRPGRAARRRRAPGGAPPRGDRRAAGGGGGDRSTGSTPAAVLPLRARARPPARARAGRAERGSR